MKKQLTIETEDRFQLIDITNQVENFVAQNKVKSGICLVFVPHSTAAIILTENEDGLKNDWLRFLKKLIEGEKFSAKGRPASGWEHDRIDDNAESHLLSGLLGQGKILPIEDGHLVRGTWQQIFLVELDGPRTRKVTIKIIKDL